MQRSNIDNQLKKVLVFFFVLSRMNRCNVHCRVLMFVNSSDEMAMFVFLLLIHLLILNLSSFFVLDCVLLFSIC